MRDTDIYSLQLGDIELFLEAANTGSFTKAGQKLFISQSAVSKRISALEQELDIELFDRSKRTLTLTPAGRVLSKRMSAMYDDMLGAIQEAYDAQRGFSGHIELAFIEWGNLRFISSVAKFIDDNPQISVGINRFMFRELRESLVAGKVDIAVTTEYDASVLPIDEYMRKEIESVRMMAYMSRKHPFSKRESISFKDLAGEPILMVNSDDSPGYFEYMRSHFAECGYRPDITHFAHSGGDHIGNVLLGEGILVASENFLGDSFQGEIAAVPLDVPPIKIEAVWKAGNANPVIERLLGYL